MRKLKPGRNQRENRREVEFDDEGSAFDNPLSKQADPATEQVKTQQQLDEEELGSGSPPATPDRGPGPSAGAGRPQRQRRYSGAVTKRAQNTKWSANSSGDAGSAAALRAAEAAAQEEADIEAGKVRDSDGSAPAGFFKLQRAEPKAAHPTDINPESEPFEAKSSIQQRRQQKKQQRKELSRGPARTKSDTHKMQDQVKESFTNLFRADGADPYVKIYAGSVHDMRTQREQEGVCGPICRAIGLNDDGTDAQQTEAVVGDVTMVAAPRGARSRTIR